MARSRTNLISKARPEFICDKEQQAGSLLQKLGYCRGYNNVTLTTSRIVLLGIIGLTGVYLTSILAIAIGGLMRLM